MSYNQKKNLEQNLADKETETKIEPNGKEFKTPSKFLANQKSLSSVDSGEQNSEKTKIELKFFGVSEFYIQEISQKLISKYGHYFLRSFDQKKLNVPPSDFMSKHEIKPIIRTKMVGWMLEVFDNFNSNEEAIFSAVKMMDKYIWKTKDKLKSEDIHLIGMACMYLASKTYDKNPIHMNHLIHRVGHDIFTPEDIQEMEKKIIKAINFDIFCPTTYEFIQFLLYDLYFNNKEGIARLKLKKELEILENCSIFLAKMCNHFDRYSSVSPINLTIVCVVVAFDMMKENCKSLTEKKQKFFKDWLQFIYSKIANTQEIKTDIENIYTSVEKTYAAFGKMKLKNLTKFHELYFN